MLADVWPVTVMRVLVQQPGVLEPLEDERHAAGGVEIRRDVLAARLEVAEQRGALADPVEIVD